MSTIEITAPDGKVLELDAPDGATGDQIHQAATMAAEHYKSVMSAATNPTATEPKAPPIFPDATDPTRLIKQAAPSNVLSDLGVGATNAPGAAGLAINSLPGMGNPAQIIPSIQNIAKDPKQVLRAFQRMGTVQSGGDPTAQEAGPSLMGKVAGNVIEAAAPPSLDVGGIKATGPFTAGLKDPSTAAPGAFEAAGEALAKVKAAARAGEAASDAARFRVMLQKPSGTIALAEEGKKALESGADLPITHLLAYKEALGKMQAEGGTFAGDYKAAADAAKDLIAKKAPDLSEKTSKMALQYIAKGDGPKFPWFTTALNPQVGVAKMLSMPGPRNTAGAMLSPIANNLNRAGALASMAKTLTVEKAKEYLRKARGVKDIARQLAAKEGWTIPE